MQRQQILTRSDIPARLWVVVDEAALRRPIGGHDVMRGQVEALLEINNSLPNVRLQVIPFNAGGHAAAGGAFSILRFPDEDHELSRSGRPRHRLARFRILLEWFREHLPPGTS